MTCKPHQFEVFSVLHQCIHCGMRIEDHQTIEKLEKRIVELEAIKKALITELPPIDQDPRVGDRGEPWPHEPCGRSLEQCPYDKSEHIGYFNAHGDKPNPFTFR